MVIERQRPSQDREAIQTFALEGTYAAGLAAFPFFQRSLRRSASFLRFSDRADAQPWPFCQETKKPFRAEMQRSAELSA